MLWYLLPSIVVLASGSSQAAAAPTLARDAQSLLASKCVACHGANKRKGGLRLDLHASIMAGGATGPAVEAGRGKTSLLLQRIRGEGDEDRMPPEGEPLSAREMALLESWIDAGAPWPAEAGGGGGTSEEEPSHWAYRVPMPPPVPAIKHTANANVGNPIDAFVLAQLQQQGLRFSPAAPRATLLRRLSLDLTGLPPTPRELDAFEQDMRPGALARQVDRLLASPHFGERWARWWLDLARYADSHGYEKDRPRVMWPYRDWVIEAFNKNMSFRQFTIEQLAGDMLPGASQSQRIATGFHRNTLINQEGGVDPEEAYFETLVDRVGTTASVWLGSTLACAQCHNHKFDPFSQKDFFKFMAFFANNETSLQGTLFDDLHMGEPTLSLPTPPQAEAKAALDEQIAAVEAEMSADTPARQKAQAAWEKEQLEVEARWHPLAVEQAISRGGARMSKLEDGSLVVSGPMPSGDVYEITARTALPRITGVRLEVLPDPSLPHGGPGRGTDGGFLLTGFELSMAAPQAEAAVTHFSAAAADEHLSSFGPQTLLYMKPEGWAIDVDAPAPRARRQAVFAFARPLEVTQGTKFQFRLSHPARAQRAIGRFRLSVTSSDEPLFATQIKRKDRAALEAPAAKRTEEQKLLLRTCHAKHSSFFAPQRERLKELRKKIKDLGVVTAMVLQERPGFERPSTLMRARGSYASPGERVFADVPKFLPPLPPEAPPNRLGLARWLVDERNPLTARVTVNRIWEQLFGRGLLETSEDFGTQSPAPSHRELLDWLATEYMRLGWDTKALLRTIVLSTTYQQSSKLTQWHNQHDPFNHLLSRGPRFRLDAETLRDSALAAAGLLAPQIGGPSVFPWQPSGVWEVPYNDPSLVWDASAGQDAHRRTLYTFLRRSAPYPFLITFDASSRETCTLRRPRTNTPLQVLNTLNDRGFFEAAQALAGRMHREGGASLSQRLRYGFRLATGRIAGVAEVRHLETLFRQQRATLQSAPERVAALLRNPTASAPAAPASVASPANAPDLAAFTLVANVLLNLDETLTKE